MYFQKFQYFEEVLQFVVSLTTLSNQNTSKDCYHIKVAVDQIFHWILLPPIMFDMFSLSICNRNEIRNYYFFLLEMNLILLQTLLLIGCVYSRGFIGDYRHIAKLPDLYCSEFNHIHKNSIFHLCEEESKRTVNVQYSARNGFHLQIECHGDYSRFKVYPLTNTNCHNVHASNLSAQEFKRLMFG